MTTKKQVRRLLGTETCRLLHSAGTGYVFVLYTVNEFRNLPEILGEATAEHPEGAPGPAVELPTDPGAPNTSTYAQTANYLHRKEAWDNYQTILKFTREAIKYSFPTGNVLLSQENDYGILT